MTGALGRDLRGWSQFRSSFNSGMRTSIRGTFIHPTSHFIKPEVEIHASVSLAALGFHGIGGVVCAMEAMGRVETRGMTESVLDGMVGMKRTRENWG